MFNEELSEDINMFFRVLIVVVSNHKCLIVFCRELHVLIRNNRAVHYIMNREFIHDAFVEIFVRVEFHNKSLLWTNEHCWLQASKGDAWMETCECDSIRFLCVHFPTSCEHLPIESVILFHDKHVVSDCFLSRCWFQIVRVEVHWEVPFFVDQKKLTHVIKCEFHVYDSFRHRFFHLYLG